MKIKNIFFLVIAILVLNSCEQDAKNVDLPYEPPRLVIHAFITPGDSIKLTVTSSAPIYNTINSQIKPINDATVLIYIDENNPLQLTNIGEGVYMGSQDELEVVAGNTYKVKVTRNGYDQVTSECVVIDEPKFEISVTNIQIGIGQWGDSTATITSKIKAIGTSDNIYYRVIPYGIIEQDGYKDSNELYSYNYESQYLKLNANDEITFKYETYFTSYYKFNKIRFVVLKPDDHYYKYHHSLENYNGDDFFSEPSIIYTNIKNGYGVFCSYNRKDTVITLNYK